MITALYRLLDLLTRIGRGRPALRPEQPFDRKVEPAGWTRLDRRRRPISHRRENHLRAVSGDAGMTTAEYAVGTVAAVAFAVVLFKVVQSPAVHTALSGIVTGALHVHM